MRCCISLSHIVTASHGVHTHATIQSVTVFNDLIWFHSK